MLTSKKQLESLSVQPTTSTIPKMQHPTAVSQTKKHLLQDYDRDAPPQGTSEASVAKDGTYMARLSCSKLARHARSSNPNVHDGELSLS